MKAIMERSSPTTVTQLKRFLGMIDQMNTDEQIPSQPCSIVTAIEGIFESLNRYGFGDHPNRKHLKM